MLLQFITYGGFEKMPKWLLKKNGIIGGFMVLKDRYDLSGEATHVRLTVEEYDILMAEKNQLIHEFNKRIYELQDTLNQKQDAWSQQLSDERNMSAAKISELKEQVAHEKTLNNNLRRIATERANKSRKLNKHDNGYLILSWQPYSYKQSVKGKKSIETHYLYKLIVQTPWDCSLSEKQIDHLITEDVNNNILKISEQSGIKWCTPNDLDSAIASMKECSREENVILFRQARSNGRTGLWEVTFITNFEPVLAEKHRIRYV